jgi:predicted P-loop ATPase
MMPANEQENLIVFTVGEGRRQPQGLQFKCAPTVQAVAEALRKQPATIERWWSMHLWKKNKRSGEAWLASSGVSCDIDHVRPEMPSDALVERLKGAASTGELPGAIFHLTPHGARIVWVYEKPCSDRAQQIKAERGARALVQAALEKLGLTDYEVDQSTVSDLARFFYTPNSIAKGVRRDAQVYVMRETFADPADLGIYDVPAREVAAPPPPQVIPIAEDVQEAINNWNRQNAQEWPRNTAPCPMCGDTGSFGMLPSDPSRWYCFSTDHKSPGVRGERGMHGDALDLEAFKRGVKTIEVLKKDGYLKRRQQQQQATEQANEALEQYGTEESDEAIGYWRSRSYLTAVGLIQQNYRDILEKRKLELNEMSGEIEIGRVQIKDADAHRIRYLIEKRVPGGVDKKNNPIGLQLSQADVFAAITQVANERSYHPVRDYLNGLEWDGVPRIVLVAKLLGAQDTPINQIMIRRFFISAVARPLEPGCKVDTIFILQGPQGALKSSFFRVLSQPWFIDTPIDISADPVRAYMTMRKAWLLEWAELDTLFRARTASTVKAFITSAEDSYVPKHARFSVAVKRTGLVCGTLNPDEFLHDDTGHRRFWPIACSDYIDLLAVEKMRDQLWAEAVAIYTAAKSCAACGTGLRCAEHRWWLAKEEEALLAPVHSKYEVADAWATPIIEYLSGRDSTSVQEVLQKALLIEIGRWSDRDMKRVTRVLKASGEWKPDPNKTKGKPRLWVRTGGNTGVENAS